MREFTYAWQDNGWLATWLGFDTSKLSDCHTYNDMDIYKRMIYWYAMIEFGIMKMLKYNCDS